MAAPALSVVISGRNDLQAVINQSQNQLKAFAAHTQRTQQQVAKVTGMGRGIDTINKSFLSLGRSTWGVFQNVSRIVDPLRVITGAGSIAGIVGLEAAVARLGQTQVNTARGLNMSVGNLSRWQGAAKIAGVSASSTASSISGLEKALTGARVGTNAQAAAVLTQEFGNSWRGMSDDQLMMAESQRLQHLSPQNRAAAMEKFGSALGQSGDFVSFLAQGPATVQSQLNQATANGAMNGQQAGVLNTLSQQINSLEGAITGTGTAIASTLAPNITTAVTAITSWIDKNRALIAIDVKGWVSAAVDRLKSVDWKNAWAGFESGLAYLKGIDWKSIFSGVEKVLGQVNSVAQSIGGWKTTIEALLGVFVLSKLAPIVGVFAGMATSLTSISASLLALPGLFPAIAAAITGAGLADMFLHASTAANDTMSGPPVAGGGTPITPKQAGANMQAIEDHYRSIYGNSGAAAIMGNAFAESSGNPAAVGPGGSYGLFQLNNAQQALFRKVEGFDVHGSTAAQQLNFMDWQLAHNYQGLDKVLRDPTASAGAKTGAFMKQYEAPADMSLKAVAGRALYANEYFNGMPPAGTAPVPSFAPSPVTASDRLSFMESQEQQGIGMGSEDRSVQLTVNVEHGMKVKTRSKGGSIIKKQTAMPGSGPSNYASSGWQ